MDAPSASPFFVPFPRPDLIGRDEDVERLHEVLQQSRTAAVTPALTGQGGIGKTQLAVRYAYDKAGAYPGGVFWLNAAREAESPTTQLAAFAYKMGLPLPNLAGDASEIDRRAALAWTGQAGSRGDALVVADNVDDPALLARDLRDLPGTRLLALGCRTLVTSREADLPGCTDFKVDFLARDAARDLLLKEFGRSGAAGNETAIEDILRLLGGLPLALRLAGALLTPSTDVKRFADLLRERGAISQLDAAGRPLDDYKDGMQVSLQALLAESWDALSSEQKDVLRALSTLPETAILRVGLLRELLEPPKPPKDASGIADRWEEALDALRQRNLLERLDGARVRLHPLIYKYAREQTDRHLREALEARLVGVANRRRSADYLAGSDADELLTLLRELPMLEAIADKPAQAEARLELGRLRRCLDLQAHHLRLGSAPLPHLHRQAERLGDGRLVENLDAALKKRGEPWLRQVWSTAGVDPAARCSRATRMGCRPARCRPTAGSCSRAHLIAPCGSGRPKPGPAARC